MRVYSSALAVQIYLLMDRLDLARNEVASVKTWAEDALLLQMMEAWVDLRVVSCQSPNHSANEPVGGFYFLFLLN